MKSLIRKILKEESDKQTDLANTQSNDLDNLNTYAHKISSVLCK